MKSIWWTSVEPSLILTSHNLAEVLLFIFPGPSHNASDLCNNSQSFRINLYTNTRSPIEKNLTFDLRYLFFPLRVYSIRSWIFFHMLLFSFPSYFRYFLSLAMSCIIICPSSTRNYFPPCQIRTPFHYSNHVNSRFIFPFPNLIRSVIMWLNRNITYF